MGEHRERAGERQQAIGAGAVGEGPVGEFADEAGHTGELFGERAGVCEAFEALSAFTGRRCEWNSEHGG